MSKAVTFSEYGGPAPGGRSPRFLRAMRELFFEPGAFAAFCEGFTAEMTLQRREHLAMADVFRQKATTLAAGLEQDEHRDAARQALRGFREDRHSTGRWIVTGRRESGIDAGRSARPERGEPECSRLCWLRAASRPSNSVMGTVISLPWSTSPEIIARAPKGANEGRGVKRGWPSVNLPGHVCLARVGVMR
jgi:hypothetical protein